MVRHRGDYGFNLFHNSNPQHGGSYARHEKVMNAGEVEDFLASVKGWDHDPETNTIWRSFYFDTFDEAYRFMGRLYAFCYCSDKYPHVTWDNLRIDMHLYSPSFKGISRREARIAAFMNDQYNMLKKAKLQRSKLVEMNQQNIGRTVLESETSPTVAASTTQARPQLPEVQNELRSWKDLI